jgi:hypothetical protein
VRIFGNLFKIFVQRQRGRWAVDVLGIKEREGETQRDIALGAAVIPERGRVERYGVRVVAQVYPLILHSSDSGIKVTFTILLGKGNE